ncbi:NADH-quinone oxidoreductase subunit J [Deltaproteobacteria bacterium OttesenSCG-928-K17]|nr:NADH-quinone oxidoreductase subunit J [Deltaproteobacteria bacterium OttesenSCG-928-K17]
MSALISILDAGAVKTPAFIENMGNMMLPDAGHTLLAYLAFALYLGLIAAGGLAAVLSRNLVRAMMGLVVTFMGVAGMYLLMASPFMAFMQLLIYVGAISVLIFFAIRYVNNTSSGEEMHMPELVQAALAGLSALAVMVVFAPVIILNAGKKAVEALPSETPLPELGEGLLSYYVVPFELISIILLVAMAGGVFLNLDKLFRGK